MEYQKIVLISFARLEKINNFCFMHNSVVQTLSLPRLLVSNLEKSQRSVHSRVQSSLSYVSKNGADILGLNIEVFRLEITVRND